MAVTGCCWIAGVALSWLLLVWLLDWRVLSRLARALPIGCWLLVAGADSPARLIGCSIGALLIVASPVLDGGGCFPVGC